MNVCTLYIDNIIDKNNFSKLLELVSVEKKEHLLKYLRFEDAQRALLGDVLARYAICKRINIKNRDLIFGTNEYGKPILLKPGNVHFNISHSGNWVVCVVDNNQVGIDVETVKPIELNIVEKFFSKNEFEAIMNQSDDKKLDFFYKLWTLKECYIKADGRGLRIPLNTFSFNIVDNNISMSSNSLHNGYNFYQSHLDSTSIFAICSINKHIKCKTSWKTEQFIHEVLLDSALQ